jgi:hypothetical protein
VPSFAAQRHPMPHVEGVKLAPEETTALQRRAREEGVTNAWSPSVAVRSPWRQVAR